MALFCLSHLRKTRHCTASQLFSQSSMKIFITKLKEEICITDMCCINTEYAKHDLTNLICKEGKVLRHLGKLPWKYCSRHTQNTHPGLLASLRIIFSISLILELCVQEQTTISFPLLVQITVQFLQTEITKQKLLVNECQSYLGLCQQKQRQSAALWGHCSHAGTGHRI